MPVTDKRFRLYSFTAFLFLFYASQALFFVALRNGTDPAGIVSGDLFILQASNECLCFSGVALIVFLMAIGDNFRKGKARMLLFSILVFTVPVLIVMCIMQGRLVYPLQGLQLSRDSSNLMQSIYYGGQHIAFLCFAAVLVIGGILAKSAIKKTVMIGSGVLALAEAYSWLLPWTVNLAAVSIMAAVTFLCVCGEIRSGTN